MRVERGVFEGCPRNVGGESWLWDDQETLYTCVKLFRN